MKLSLDEAFPYTNLSQRPAGPFLSVLSRLVPAVGRVQAQARPFAAQWRASNLRALADRGPLWVALGDSLSQGLGAPAYDRGWVGQLQRMLRDQGQPHRVVNLSISGARTAEVIERQIPALGLLSSLGQVPELVTLLIGSNDLMTRRRPELTGAYQRLLSLVPATTVVATLPNPTRTAGAVNRVITTGAARRGLRVAETRVPETTRWHGKLASDHFHPNERGYTSIARVFERAIRERPL